MADNIPLTPRPQLPNARPAQALQVVARPQDYGPIAGARQSDLQGLIRGLESFNPALRQAMQNAHRQSDIDEAERAKADKVGGQAFSQQVPQDKLGEAITDPTSLLPQAYSKEFLEAYKVGIGHRIAIQYKSDLVNEYASQKDAEGFNPETWLSGRRNAIMAGIRDPQMAAVVGGHLNEVQGSLLGDMVREQAQKREAARVTTMTQLAADAFTADMPPDQWYDRYTSWFLPQAKSIGFDPKQAAAVLLTQVEHASTKAGGLPELFDVFDRKDPEGFTLWARNPQLAGQIDAARAKALQTREKALMEAADGSNARLLMDIEKDLEMAPEKVTEGRILSMLTKFGPIQSPQQAASILGRALDAQHRSAALKEMSALFDSGELWRLPADDQGKVLESRLGGVVNQLVQASMSGDQASMQRLASQIMVSHSGSRASIPVGALERFTRSLVTNLPNPSGPTPQFKAAAELYKAFSADPTYRAQYFKDDVAQVLDSFVHASAGGTDEKAAYVTAYQSISPEAKAAAAKVAADPEFQKRVSKIVSKYAEGSSWFPRWIGGNGRPENQGAISTAAASEARLFMARNPNASEQQVEGHLESWSARNFVLDTTTRMAIKIPPGLSGQLTQEAVSNYSKDLIERYRLGDREDGNWALQYMPVGTEGQYQVFLFNGSASQLVGQVALQDIINRERNKSLLTDEERGKVGAYRQALRTGSQLPELSSELLGKAKMVGALRPEELRQWQSSLAAKFAERVASIPALAFGKPSPDSLAYIPSKAKTRVDNQLTARAALEFAGQPVYGPGQQHVGLAASLVTMGEGVMLEAYEDPASGAGRNIGMGYNLNANRDHVLADLKRSGLDEAAATAVRDGKAQLTPDQAKRLLQVAMPRYERQAIAAADETAPGLWDRMTPAQKAVMIDVAWQVGDPAQFKRAWGAIVSGDSEAFTRETKVFYTDRKGNRREDTRRGNLRATMLAGISRWEALVSNYGGLPSSKLQALGDGQALSAVPRPSEVGERLRGVMDRWGEQPEDAAKPGLIGRGAFAPTIRF